MIRSITFCTVTVGFEVKTGCVAVENEGVVDADGSVGASAQAVRYVNPASTTTMDRCRIERGAKENISAPCSFQSVRTA
jgi:hypothetical protein